MGGSPQRIFEHTIWMAHTVIHKNTLLEDCHNLLFLILTKPACDRSLDPSTEPLVCGMDVITIFIAWNFMSLYYDMVLQHLQRAIRQTSFQS